MMKKMIWAGAGIAALALLLLAAVWLFFFLRNPPGQIGWWKLNDGRGSVARDSSRLFGHNGKLMHTGFKWVAGEHGGALQFNGNQHVLLGTIFQGG
jgi:hypothetical protein